jgi:hypothetical protein
MEMGTRLGRAGDKLPGIGAAVFSLAVAALGVETLDCAFRPRDFMIALLKQPQRNRRYSILYSPSSL